MKKIIGVIIAVLTIITIQSNIAFAQEESGFGSHRGVEGIDVYHTDDPGESDEALHIATRTIDWILGLTGLVAIIVFLIGGFKVLTSNGDDTKAKGGYKIIKNAIIGLLIIGLTRTAIRLIFWFVNGMVGAHDFNSDG